MRTNPTLSSEGEARAFYEHSDGLHKFGKQALEGSFGGWYDARGARIFVQEKSPRED